jgi:parvulin-like peptidyl-prolyl isomerase
LLIDGHVQEEMLYREAIRLGLDQNDVIIRRRLIQKLKFLVEDVSKATNPTDAVLRGFFEKHPDKYFLPARISFSHLYFNKEKRGAALSHELRITMIRLNKKAGDKDLSEIKWLGSGDPFMLRSTYNGLTLSETANLFGRAFANAVFKLDADNLWYGPVSSGFGEHLVRVSSFTHARQPDFDEVKKLVAKDFAITQRAQATTDLINELEKKYQVFIDVLINES